MRNKRQSKTPSSKKFRPLALVPGLQETGFSANHWQDARVHLSEKIGDIVPGWLGLSKSIFVARWRSQDSEAVGFLVLFSWQCRTLFRKSTPRSASILDKKIREIVTAVNREKFDEYYTEWCVLDMLACRAAEIDLEPYADEEAAKHGRMPSSPDCLIRTSGAELCIEVTLCRFPLLGRGAGIQKEVLDLFDAAASAYFAVLGQEILVWPRHISLQIPSDLEDTQGLGRAMSEVVRQVFTTHQGQLHVETGYVGMLVSVTWECPPDLPGFAKEWHERYPLDHYYERNPDGTASNILRILKWWVEANFYLEDLDDLVVETLRRVRDTKSKQFKAAKPTFLVVRIEHPTLKPMGVLRPLSDRIWANDRFRCLSGLIVHVARDQFTSDVPTPSLIWSLNPNANLPVSEDFVHTQLAGPMPQVKLERYRSRAMASRRPSSH